MAHGLSAPVVIGVDEAGAGALCGPLVVCATAFLKDESPVSTTWQSLKGEKTIVISDSKSVKKPEQRAALAEAVRRQAHGVAVVERSSKEIDQYLYGRVHLEALKTAIARCLEQVVAKGFHTTPSEFLVVVDGDVPVPQGLPCRVLPIADADRTVWQVSAASMVAKVACDARMMEIHAEYPDWGFDKSKGYPTKEHKKLLKARGPLPVHRLTYRPVMDVCGPKPGFML